MGAVVALFIMILAAGLGLVILGMRRPSQGIAIEERLAQYGHRVPTLEELELGESFYDRVLGPTLRRVADFVGQYTPAQSHERLRERLEQAGVIRRLGPTEFTGLRFVLGGGLAIFFLMLFVATDASAALKLLFPAVGAGVGYFLPSTWLSRRIKQRQVEIQRALPDAIDLLTISVEAGLGFDPAVARVVEKWDNALTRELARMLSEVRVGQARRDAMRDLARRVDLDDLNVFVSSIVQADQLGVSISQVLRAQSRQMRIRRRQRAEEQAQKAPIKMLFPMVFFIFPSLFIVLLGPAVPRMYNVFTNVF